ncbi:MAG: DsbA family oxidoreductase [Nostocoides sp.]
MRIDVWSDLVCPFCHIGRRRLELALAGFEHADEVSVTWHSYELDRGALPIEDQPTIDLLADKYGRSREELVAQHEHMAIEAADVGLDFNWRELVGGNSYDAHRLIHYARSIDQEEPVTERLMRAWYSHGAALGDRQVLQELAVAGGLDADAVAALLESDDFGMDVRTDEAQAAEIGISAVPTFVFDQKYAVQGAQPVPVFLAALRQVWDERTVAPTPAEDGCGACACGSGGCGATSTV